MSVCHPLVSALRTPGVDLRSKNAAFGPQGGGERSTRGDAELLLCIYTPVALPSSRGWVNAAKTARLSLVMTKQQGLCLAALHLSFQAL